MKIIDAKFHSILDYLVVVALWVSPAMFDFTDRIAIFTYVLGGIHLLLTLLTDFPGGIIRIIPLKVHGMIELLVSCLLMVLALSVDIMKTEQVYYICFSVLVFLTWLLTDYTQRRKALII